MRKQDGPLEHLIKHLSSLPGLGPRSARRVALHLIERKMESMRPLIASLQLAADTVVECQACGNLDTINPCRICTDTARDNNIICVVATVADVWAIERTGAFKGLYHILGGVVSALDGISPDQLRIASLYQRIQDNDIREVILALSATVDGQATAHIVQEKLHSLNVHTTRLAHGVPVGGELDYLDDGTIVTALRSRARA